MIKVVCIDNIGIDIFFKINEIYNAEPTYIGAPYPDVTLAVKVYYNNTSSIIDMEDANRCFILLSDIRDQRIDDILY